VDLRNRAVEFTSHNMLDIDETMQKNEWTVTFPKIVFYREEQG